MTYENPSVSRSIAPRLAALACLAGLVGVADSAHAQVVSVDRESPDAAEAEVRAISSPSSLAFAEVTANGTGCPAGTWSTEISDDGNTFTTTFSAYEANVEPGTSFRYFTQVPGPCRIECR